MSRFFINKKYREKSHFKAQNRKDWEKKSVGNCKLAVKNQKKCGKLQIDRQKEKSAGNSNYQKIVKTENCKLTDKKPKK